MAQDNSNALTWVLGGALVLIGLFVVILLVSVNSQADTVNTSTTASNAAPTVDTAVIKQSGASVIGGTILLSAGTTATVTVEGQISDLNGTSTSFALGDLDKVEAVLFRGGQTCAIPATTDNNFCYYKDSSDSSCTISNSGATTVTYTCTFNNLQFFADSTSTGGTDPTGNWQATVKATDDSTANHSLSSGLTDVATLLALNIPGTIGYGTLALAQNTIAQVASQDAGDNRKMTITQYGNDVADVEVLSGAAMSCANNTSIPVANQKWSLTDLSYVASVASGNNILSGVAVDTNLAVGYRTVDATPVTKDLFWNISIPTSNVTGSCSGTTTVTAIAA